MKLHFYEKEKKPFETEFISEGEFHFIKKIKPPCEKKKTRFFHIRK
jgi:hypothetical protein